MKMEHVGAISEGEWNNNYGAIYSSSNNEEADFMAQLLGNCPLPNEHPTSSSFLASCWPVHGPSMEISSLEETSMYSSNNNSSDDSNNNNNNNNNVTSNMFYYFSQSSGYSSGHNEMYPMSSDQPYVCNSKDDNFMESGDNFLVQDLSNDDDNNMEYSNEKKGDDHENGFLGIKLQLGMEHVEEVLPHNESSLSEDDEKVSYPKDNNVAKKRPPPHAYVQKNKRSVKPKKNQSILSSDNNGDNENETPNIQRQNSTMSYCSEDDESNGSLKLNGGATTSSTSKSGGGATNNVKTRASRGSATDPQSLYARKRREKINERLRILQNLVPNGTKVDISTMLEEAVQYVKFLQLQIKLLSSDDLWMYSPIAYNGMDMGLDLKIASHNL